MVFGVAVAFTMERSDRSIKSPEEVERFLCLPPLGSVPAVNSLNSKMYALPALETSELPGWKSSDQKRAGEGPLGNGLRPGDSQAAVALGEAFRSLCASVLFSSTGPAPRSILIASAEPREGKTTVASNLAIALAELGNRVLIVDADMRRPKLHKLFEVSGVSSLASYLAGERPWRAMAQPTRIEGLDALFCGAIPLNPVELLSTERLRKLLDEAKREYKYVIIDSPPLLSVADGRILASFIEGTVLVVKSGVTPRVLLQRAGSSVRDVGGNIVGVVLNNFDYGEYSREHYHYYASNA